MLEYIGTALQIFGAISSGNQRASQMRAEAAAAQQAAANNANIARGNAALAQKQAFIAADQGVVEEDRVRRLGAITQGKLIANYGASGVVSSEGSPLDIIAESAGLAELDAQTVKYKTALRVQSYQDRAAQFERDAQWMLQSGSAAASRAYDAADDAETAGWLKAGSYLLGGISKYGPIGGNTSGSDFEPYPDIYS